MRPRGTGNIVIMASLAGHDGGGPGASHYGASKGALRRHTPRPGQRSGPPGLIATRFHDVFNTPQGRAAGVERTPLRREGQPEDVAHASLYLSSPGASFITGEVIWGDDQELRRTIFDTAPIHCGAGLAEIGRYRSRKQAPHPIQDW